ncbi:uncharacterized protein LOC143519745 [Brachyhypopomus gauderio]|uniref:uncharacterized protein LOC143519745 n=1 Tax=Brachyhypopomus gauderio TaxID=698409 RepID=UPI0040431A22
MASFSNAKTKTVSSAAVIDQPSIIYPPTNNLERVVKYIFTQKKVPSKLPKELTIPRPVFSYPKRLVPKETKCTVCSGKPSLEGPVMITDKARIVGIDGIIENLFRLCMRKHRSTGLRDEVGIQTGLRDEVGIQTGLRDEVGIQTVSDLKEPCESYNGEVHIEEFWNSVSTEMIARGFVPSRAKNPLAVHPSYENWAPWIGGHTRKGDRVLNTEYEKVLPTKENAEAELFLVTEERLVDELKKQKVGTVRKLCKECHIDPKGSRDDLIVRLHQEMKTRHTYDKVFQKIWGASGGWCVIACPHGVVYSLKFNLRAESPRDFTDLLLSWKHLPNVSIYDFARGLATHANLRFPTSIPFRPYEGRLTEPTFKNISAAQKGKLKVCLPWLDEKAKNPHSIGHPVTGASCHFVLYDKLHERNSKDQRDVLRRIDLVPELQGSVNSQVAEQLFGSMRKNNYFMNNMAPSTHVFLMQNIMHHRNTALNHRLLEMQLKQGLMGQHSYDITLNELGQAVIAAKAPTSTQQSDVMFVERESPARAPTITKHSDVMFVEQESPESPARAPTSTKHSDVMFVEQESPESPARARLPNIQM